MFSCHFLELFPGGLSHRDNLLDELETNKAILNKFSKKISEWNQFWLYVQLHLFFEKLNKIRCLLKTRAIYSYYK